MAKEHKKESPGRASEAPARELVPVPHGIEVAAAASPQRAADRLQAMDWLRGAAVLVMIQCHALVLLRPDLRHGVAFIRVDRVDGLVAPAFLTAAGFSISLVVVRAALAGKLRDRIKKTSRRILEVYAVAYLFSLMLLGVLYDPALWLRTEILHCIAFSLTLAFPVAIALASRPRVLAGVGLGVAGGVFAVSPFAERVTGLWSHFVNSSSGSSFPLFPWAGYVFLGFALGAAAARGGRRSLAIVVAALAGVGTLLANLDGPLLRAYPPHQFWVTNPSSIGGRVAMVMLFTLGLIALEAKLPQVAKTRAVRVLAFFGTSSLSAYFFHEALLYYRVFGFSFDALWRDRCGWWSYSLLTIALIASTAVVTMAWDRIWSARSARAHGRLAAEGAPCVAQPRHTHPHRLRS